MKNFNWRDWIDKPEWPAAGNTGEKPDGFDFYDILDHVQDPTALLKEAEGEIRIRCHPWTARHGGHAKINKAFAHLVIPPVDMCEFGPLPFNKKISDISVYEKWIRESGLTLVGRNVIREKVEPWILENLPLIRYGEKLSNGLHGAEAILQVSYVDLFAYRKNDRTRC